MNLSCEAVRLAEFRRVGKFLLDLSPRGAMLACDEKVELGQELIVSFQLPLTGVWVDTEAEVVRIGNRVAVDSWARPRIIFNLPS